MKPFLLLLSTITLIWVAHAQQAPPRKIVLKVNLGGGPVADFLGEDQVLETEGLHKTTTKDVIENTDQQEIFQSQRFARGEDFVMRIPVPDGIYSLTLLFAETYKKACTPGGRVFDISLGTPVSGVTKILEAFDVFQAAGCASAHGKRFDKIPSKEGIVLHLGRKTQHPSLSGFIVEGFPVPKGDGSEYRAVGQPQQEAYSPSDQTNPMGAPPAGIPGETGNHEQIGVDMQSAVPGTMMTEGQQAMQIPQRSQMDIDQSQTGGAAEGMGSQPAGLAVAIGAQPHPYGIRMRRA